jgi:hypothetical protein
MTLIANDTLLTPDSFLNSAMLFGLWSDGNPHICTGAESYAEIAQAEHTTVAALLALNGLPANTDPAAKPKRGTPLKTPDFSHGKSSITFTTTDDGGDRKTSPGYGPIVADGIAEQTPDIPPPDNQHKRDGFLAETRQGTALAVGTQRFRMMQAEWAAAARVTYIGPADPYLQSLSPEYRQKLLFDAEVQQASKTLYEMSTNPNAYDFNKVRTAQDMLTQKGYNDIIQHYGDLKRDYGAAGIAFFWLLSYQNSGSALSLVGGLDIPAGAAGGRGGKPLPIESFTPLRGYNGRYAIVTHADVKDVTGRPVEYLVDRQGVLGVGGRVEIGTSRSAGLRAGSISPETMLSTDPNGLPGTEPTPQFIVFPVPPYASQWEVRDANMKSVGFVDAKNATEAQAKAAQKIRAINGLSDTGTPPIYTQPAQPVKTPARPGTSRAAPHTPATEAPTPVETTPPGKPEPNFVIKPRSPDETINDREFANRAKKPKMQEVANYTAEKFLEQDDTRVIMIGENHMFPIKDYVLSTAKAIEAKSGRQVAMSYELDVAWQPIGDAIEAAITPGENTTSEATQTKLLEIYNQNKDVIDNLVHVRHKAIRIDFDEGMTPEQRAQYYQTQALYTMNNVAERASNGISSVFIDINMPISQNPEYLYYGMRDPSMSDNIKTYLDAHPGVIVMYVGGSAHCAQEPLVYPEISIGEKREDFPPRETTATLLKSKHGIDPYSVRGIGSTTPERFMDFYSPENLIKLKKQAIENLMINGYYIDSSAPDWEQPARSVDLIVRVN